MLRLAPILFLLSSCRPTRDLSQYVQEDPASRLLPKLELGSTLAEPQLKFGFHQIEEGRWRWVASRFSVQLKPPFASQQRGATLTLRGNLPDIVIAKTGPITLAARLNETELPPLTFSKSGELIYQVDVPAAALLAEPLILAFTTNKFLPPNTLAGDGRELALIVSAIALETKK